MSHDRPNLLIFMTDHQRGDTVLPSHPAVTPHVEEMARQGVTFSRTFCPTPHCCPSRATFFTGLYPSRHGVWNNVANAQALSHGPRPGVRLWSEGLAENGYRLAYTGKWHVSTQTGPTDHGWEDCGATHLDMRTLQYDWNLYRQIAQADEPKQRQHGQILRPGYGAYTLFSEEPQCNTEDVTALENALQVMPELVNGDSPWGLFVGEVGPHDPYNVPGRYLDLYDPARIPLPENFDDRMEDKPGIYRRMRRERFGQLSEAETRDAIRHFWAYCSFLDDQFGRLLKKLEELGAAENTLVLYTADHGDYCGEHGLFCKGIPCFRGAYHVPAVMRWPAGIIRPGRHVDHFVSLADFAPTFIELAGADPIPNPTGKSLVPFLKNRDPDSWRDAIFTQCNGVEHYFTQRSVTTERYKYVYNAFDEDELYDLVEDPCETVNLARTPGYERISRALMQRIWRFMHEQDDVFNSRYITVSVASHGPADAFRDTINPENEREE